jgi:hypothetical protein
LKLLFFCAAALAAAQSFSATAQPAARLKARLTAFDGETMTLEPVTAAAPAPAASGKQVLGPPAPPPPAPLTVSVVSATRYVGSGKALFGDIKPGDYAGAAFAAPTGDHLRAEEVFVYADALRGTGQGRFPEGDRVIINGTVGAVKPSTPQDQQDGTLTIHYHGSVLTGLGRGKTVCEGRASPPAYASALACEADAEIEVRPGTPVSSLSEGDKSLLVPGSMVTVSIVKTADGKNITPGVIVEKAPPPVEKALPPPVEKPQTPP